MPKRTRSPDAAGCKASASSRMLFEAAIPARAAVPVWRNRRRGKLLFTKHSFESEYCERKRDGRMNGCNSRSQRDILALVAKSPLREDLACPRSTSHCGAAASAAPRAATGGGFNL